MADDKPKRIMLVSPRGRFNWPRLNAPDYGSKEYPNPDGSYRVDLILDAKAPETKKFIAALTPHYDTALEEAKQKFAGLSKATRTKLKAVTENPLFTEVFDKETEEPTGEIMFRFKMAASGERKKGPKAGTRWERKPTIFDSKGNRMVKVPDIWSGSEGRISFEVRPYFIPGTAAAGLSFGLEAVKLLALVSGGERSAEGYGFGDDDGDGYEYSAEEQADDAMSSDESDSDDGETGDF